MSAAIVPLNPFSDQIVTSPRRTEPSVRGLNDQVLRRLVSEFENVEAWPHRCARVQLVVSPAGGYGKSHLMGRLFQSLGRRATRIYVRPFNDPEGCWTSLLHTLIQELTAPEFDDGSDRGEYPPTQLDALAHGVFGTLLVGLMDVGDFSYNDPSFVRERLLKRAFEKWDLSNPHSNWGVWASEMLDSYEQRENHSARLVKMLCELTGDSLSHSTRPQAWLRVLRRYAQDRADAITRDLVLEWMRGRTPREAEATAPIALQVVDGVDTGLSPAARNALARSRVLDILALAKLFRPFILCFDQTEVFGRVPGLARAFGSLLSDLVQGEGAHLTVVTANNDVWESQLLPDLERADRDRIAPRLEMLGLTRDQGKELAAQRLWQTRLPADLREQVLAPDWLDTQFSIGLVSPREFLRRCERRYEEVVPSAPAQPARPEMMLVELYSQERKALLADPRELADYRFDVLRWALLDVPARMPTGVTAAVSRMDVPAFVSEWKNKEDKRWFLVLEEGTNALTWRAITRRAIKLRQEDAKSATVAIRIAGQLPLPQASWTSVGPEIEAAQRDGALYIITLAPDVLSRVYAVWELYTQACQGDIPHEPDAVLRFGAQRLQSWYASLRGEKSAEHMHDTSAISLHLLQANGDTAHGAAAVVPEPVIEPAPEPLAPTATPSLTLPKPPQPLVPSPKPNPAARPIGVVTPVAAAPPAQSSFSAAREMVLEEPEESVASVEAAPAEPTLSDVMRQIISVRRFVSFAEIADELRVKLSREVTVEEASAAAETSGDVRVYAQGGNAGFLWQGW
ncbi:MAG: hypothetical protein ACOYMN_04270 [Roseimicrobium sp.]